MDLLKTFACQAIDRNAKEINELGLAIWEYAEPGGKEFKSYHALKKFLTDREFIVTDYMGMRTGFKAEFGEKEFGGKKRPNIGFLCVYDAHERKGHVTGNNLVVEVAVAAALGLKEVFITSSTKLGKVTVIVCPNSTNGGLVPLLNRKAFRDIDVVLTAIPGPRTEWSPVYLGTKTYRAKYIAADMDPYQGRFKGINPKCLPKPRYKVPPTDAMSAAVQAYHNVLSVQEHFARGWKISGMIYLGGKEKAPEKVQCCETIVKITVPTNTDLALMASRIVPCFQAAAQQSRCRLDLTLAEKTLYSMISNTTLIYCLQLNAYNCGVLATPLKNKEIMNPVDMGNLSRQIPAIRPMFYIGSDEANGTEEFKSAVATGRAHGFAMSMAKALCMTAVDVLHTPGTLIDVRREHKAAVQREKNTSGTFINVPKSTKMNLSSFFNPLPPDGDTGWSRVQ